jgi:hypothetical protein
MRAHKLKIRPVHYSSDRAKVETFRYKYGENGREVLIFYLISQTYVDFSFLFVFSAKFALFIFPHALQECETTLD